MDTSGDDCDDNDLMLTSSSSLLGMMILSLTIEDSNILLLRRLSLLWPEPSVEEVPPLT